jgi:pseudaminic acid synthase
MVEIVAEISGNHDGSLHKAKKMIARAAECGCDYVKFQFYRPEDMPDRHEGDNDRMYRQLMVPDDWLPDLFGKAKESCIGLFASVFSVRAVETLLKFDVPYIKIASPESTRLWHKTYREIVKAAGAVDVLISTGLTDLSQMGMLRGDLLFCPPGHPPDLKVDDLGSFVQGPFWGFSDHTPGISAPLAFIRRGARMIEKHFKIDDDCIDAAFSADPQTMKLLCKFAHR